MSEKHQPTLPAQGGVSRRTVTKAMAWSVPVIAVAGAAPSVAASLLPCVGELTPVGGTYPVTVNLSGCSNSTSNPNHWDFNFKIRVAEQNGTDCDCDAFRVTLYDNPKRSRLGIQGGSVFNNWTGRSQNDPRMYIQTEIPPGATRVIPQAGDAVHRVAGTYPYNGYGFPGAYNLTITAHGTSNDSLHALYTPGGGTACGASGPLAYYRIDCKKDGSYAQLGGIGQINPCIPMIQSTICRVSTANNGTYRLGLSVHTACGIAPSNFHVVGVYRNDDTNFPNSGGSVRWTGDQTLSGGTTNLTVSGGNSNHDQLWISFHTGDPASTSIIRVTTPNSDNC